MYDKLAALAGTSDPPLFHTGPVRVAYCFVRRDIAKSPVLYGAPPQ